MKTLVKFLLVSLVLTLDLAAQQPPTPQAPPPLPSGPLFLKRAPNMAQWVITLVGASKQATSASENKVDDKAAKRIWAAKVVVTKTGNTIKKQTLDENNQVWTTWCGQGYQITIWPDGKNYYIQKYIAHVDPNNIPVMYTDYSTTDFPGFQWITKDYYTGIKNIGGKPCIEFKKPVEDAAAVAAPSPAAKSVLDAGQQVEHLAAYIDLKTRLPVALVENGEGHTYEFGAAPSVELSYPELVQTLLNNLNPQRAVQMHPSASF
ncbi:MAG: hypothetical protein QM796_21280 [Chthoniobacteraceae bacterium]